MDNILVVDDIASPKKDSRAIGVAPQYATTLGKTANCPTVASLTLACGGVPAAVGLALLLLETWTGDLDRMIAASVPKDRQVARTKRAIAVAEIDWAGAAGMRLGCVLGDAGYRSAPFQQALSA